MDSFAIFRARIRIDRSGRPTASSTFAMLKEGLVDTISTDYAGGHHDPIPLAIAEAVEDGATTVAAGIAMASSHIADAIPGLAPNRGRIGPGAVADVVVADSRRLNDVRWVFVAGNPVVANGELAYR